MTIRIHRVCTLTLISPLSWFAFAAQRSRFHWMKLFAILAALAFSGAAFGQATICDSPATGPQQYSLSGTGVPQHIPGALNEVLGDIPQAYVALPGMPATPLAFCGPAWQPKYPYVVGNLIEPIPGGTVFQAVGYVACASGCTSGSTQPPQFAQFIGTTYEPSPVIGWVTTCTDSGTTATCATVDAVGESVGINQLEPYEGADVGGTMNITDYSVSGYNGVWVVTASTNSKPYTLSFTAPAGLIPGDCIDIGGAPNCTTYQQGSQIIDHQILWQDVGPQNEIALLSPMVTVTPSLSSITTMQALDVTIAVTGGSGNPMPAGTVTLISGSYSSGATTLSNGGATINIPAGSLAVGTDTLTAIYSGDSHYTSATGTSSVTVTGTETPTVTVTPSASSITTMQSLNVTVAVSGGSGNPTPTGTVALTSGTYSSGTATLSSGSVMITIPAGSLAVGTDTLTGSYSGDSDYTAATGTSSVTVTVASFTIIGSPVSVAPGATTGNTSTITVKPAGGFTGSVTLTAAVTSSPAGAQDLPTFSFGSTSPVVITGTASGTATLTISTTAPTRGALAYPSRPGVSWYAAGGTGLAFILLVGVPARSRSKRTRLGALVFLAILTGGLLACGSGGGSGPSNPGTTPGTYTITVTGTSGSTTAMSPPITLTVQ